MAVLQAPQRKAMKMRRWAIGLCLFVAVLLGVLIAMRSRPGQITINFKGVAYELNVPSETLTFPAGGLTIQTRGHAITNTDGSLMIDGTRYGRVVSGDHVTMNDSGAIVVNGQIRTPTP